MKEFYVYQTTCRIRGSSKKCIFKYGPHCMYYRGRASVGRLAACQKEFPSDIIVIKDKYIKE